MTTPRNNVKGHHTLKGDHNGMLVYVKNKDGTPLMPCKPAKARKLLRDGRARVVRYRPFTIQLTWDCEAHVQEIVLGLDKGSSV